MSLRSAVKTIGFRASRAFGVQAALRHLHRRRLLVLAYHGVVRDDHSEDRPIDRFLYRNTISAARFEQQVRALRRQFTPVTPAEVIDWLEGGSELPARPVLVTLDDGYLNNLTQAAPILRRHGVPALVAVTTGYIGSDALLWPTEVEVRVLLGGAAAIPDSDGGRVVLPADPDERVAACERIRRRCKQLEDGERRAYLERLRQATSVATSAIDAELVGFLDWDQVRELHASGVTIGSHTVDHPILTTLGADDLERELTESKRRIERELGGECACLVYPNGGREDVSADVRAAVERAGYRVAFSLMDGLNAERPADRFGIDRIDIPGHVSEHVFGVRASGLYSRLTGRVGA
jgi:peptidoglycan/xylan/chitin deacetylase (PgdA/CDA1 family)